MAIHELVITLRFSRGGGESLTTIAANRLDPDVVKLMCMLQAAAVTWSDARAFDALVEECACSPPQEPR